LPSSIIAFSRANVIERPLAGGETATLPAAFLMLVVIAAAVAAMLRYTIVGRGIYALGIDRIAAERVGFNVKRLRFFVYGLMGGLAGLMGMIHVSIIRNANPKDLSGLELTVIAAAVIGGASITGGRGTITGAMLGTLLMVVITRSLVLIGLPSEWHSVLLGLVIVVSTAATATGGHIVEGRGP